MWITFFTTRTRAEYVLESEEMPYIENTPEGAYISGLGHLFVRDKWVTPETEDLITPAHRRELMAKRFRRPGNIKFDLNAARRTFRVQGVNLAEHEWLFDGSFTPERPLDAPLGELKFDPYPSGFTANAWYHSATKWGTVSLAIDAPNLTAIDETPKWYGGWSVCLFSRYQNEADRLAETIDAHAQWYAYQLAETAEQYPLAEPECRAKIAEIHEWRSGWDARAYTRHTSPLPIAYVKRLLEQPNSLANPKLFQQNPISFIPMNPF